MKIIKYIATCLILLITSANINAQELLSLKQAIDTALRNNFDILLAQKALEIQQNNNTLGNAGMLPEINADFTPSSSINNSKIEYFDRPTKESPNAKSTTLNSKVLMNWTIFDGFNMFITRKKLEEFEKLGEFQAFSAIENTMNQVILKYYEIIVQQQAIQVIKDAVFLSLERKTLAETKLNIGSSSSLVLNQAMVDLNADSVALLMQQSQLLNSKIELNYLLARNPSTEFIIQEDITIDDSLKFDILLAKTKEQNPQLFIARSKLNIANLNINEAKASRYPNFGLYAGYAFSQTNSQVGIYEMRRDMGPTYGITARMNLFDGFNTSRNIKNARVLMEMGQLEYQQANSDIESTFYKVFNQYQVSLKIIELEKGNLNAARDNVKVGLEKMQLGMLSDIDFRAIQKNQIDAENLYLISQFKAKQAEIELLRLSGELMNLYQKQ